MKSGPSFGRKRELLARGLLWSGVPLLLSHVPARDSLLVLNYHRIGNAEDDLFDPGIFSATAEDFDRQIAYLKRHLSLVTLDEALAFLEGSIKEKKSRCRVLITFDDGYLDNYSVAFPILRSHGAQGVFFLSTGMVGSCHLPWWDEIAYLVKTARKRRFTLSYPSGLAVDIDKNGVAESLQAILRSYKNPENQESARFIQELKEASMSDDPPKTLRRFLSWDEAQVMRKAGMAFGSHSHSHQVLSQLDLATQREELSGSWAILKEQLGVEANVLAYPVGHKGSFSEQTAKIALESGYRAAFSHYGGTNLRGMISPYDVKRTKMVRQSWSRFCVQSDLCRPTGIFWP
ncbi:MAG: polysaccharide deacetylase family protein [Terracidiphilus sp.]|jgi:peptidoglycan/xylan/chitin deacetylase (PgdA/CDA1 family)